MDSIILGSLGVLIALVAALILVVLFRPRSGEGSADVRASLKEDFLAFQTNIHQGLDTTRNSVESAKDVISNHALKTTEQISQMGVTLQSLIRQQEEAQQLGQSLKDLLQAPKLRGSFGEAILEEMMERVLPKGLWERQYAIDGSEIVDCVVRVKDVVIPIDAKFPRDDYMRYLEAESPEEKEASWKGFEIAVRRQIASIEGKYLRPEKGTSEFALMFIPSEAIWYETIAETNHLGSPSSLLEYAQERHVMPVSPNTFYAFLQMVMLGIRNAEVVRSAKKVQEGLASLEKSFGFFYKKYEDMGKHIDHASEAYRVGDGHVKRYKRRVEETLQLEALQESSIAELPEGSGQEGTSGNSL